MKKKWLNIMSIMIIIMLVSGCNTNKQGAIDAEKELKQVGEIVKTTNIPILEFKTMNPVLNNNLSVNYFNKLIFESLVKIDEQGIAQPFLAKSWAYNEDGLRCDFYLNENIYWHDGTHLTAEDVAFTINALKYSKSKYSSFVENIKSAQVLSNYSLAVQFKNIKNNGIGNFGFPIISKKQFSTYKNVFNFEKDYWPMGTGRYKLSEYLKFKQLTLEKNENYWNGIEQFEMETLIFKIVPELDAALSMLEIGAVDLAPAKDYDWEKFLEKSSLEVYEYQSNKIEFLAFNTKKEYLKDPFVRKAIAFSIDKQYLIDKLYLGHALDVDTLYKSNYLGVATNQNNYAINLDNAKNSLQSTVLEDLDQDGWLEDENKKEVTFNILVNEDNPKRMETAEYIMGQLNLIGFHGKITKRDWKTYQNDIKANRYDILVSGFNLAEKMDLRFALENTSYNLANYENADLNLYLETVYGSSGLDEKMEAYNKVNEILLDELPYYCLYYENGAVIFNNELVGNFKPNVNDIYNNIEQCHFEALR